MGKPLFGNWNPSSQRWESKGRDGLVKFHIDAKGPGGNQVTVGTLATIEAAKVGSGSQVDFILGLTGSSAAITAVGSQQTVVGTITNATGLAVGDKVFGVPKSTVLSDANLGLGGFYVPTTNTLNVHIVNPGNQGSLAATGWDIVAVRTS